MIDRRIEEYIQKVTQNFRKKKKTKPKVFLDDVEYDWKWSKDEKSRAWSVFVAGIIEYSAWLKTDPILPEPLRRIKHANGLYGVEIIIDGR